MWAEPREFPILGAYERSALEVGGNAPLSGKRVAEILLSKVELKVPFFFPKSN